MAEQSTKISTKYKTKGATAKPEPFAPIAAPDASAPQPVPFANPAAIAADPVNAPLPVIAEAAVEIKPVASTIVATHTEETTMNDTIENTTTAMHDAANNMGSKATEMFGDMNVRAKDAMAKGTKAIEELVEFSKGNMEALASSGRVAAKGAEEIAKYAAEYGRSTIEKANATAKQFASVKSPTEFFQLQGEVAKATLDAMVAEGSKFTEQYLKLVGEVTQPISNRVAMAADKMKSTTNA